MNKVISQIEITGTVDPITGAYDLIVDIPFIEALVFLILIFSAFYAFNLLAKILWK